MNIKAFLKNNGLIILIGLGIILAIVLISANQTAFMTAQMDIMKAKVDALQADVKAKQDAIEGIDAKLLELNNTMTQIDAGIASGELNYKSIISQLGNLKTLVNPPIIVFDNLEACKSSFEDLQRKFSLSIAALDQRETNFNLCLEKSKILGDTVAKLEEKCRLQEGISNDYKQQYEAANDTLKRITKTWKWKAIAGNVADAGMIAGAAAFIQKGNWKAAAGVAAVRYAAKLFLKI
jgi:chromosome segregation ATPase